MKATRSRPAAPERLLTLPPKPPHPNPLPLGGGEGEASVRLARRAVLPLPRRGGEGRGEGATLWYCQTAPVSPGNASILIAESFSRRQFLLSLPALAVAVQGCAALK